MDEYARMAVEAELERIRAEVVRWRDEAEVYDDDFSTALEVYNRILALIDGEATNG